VKEGASQFENFRVNFHKFQALFSMWFVSITVKLGYHKFSATWVPKMLMGANKMQRMSSALAFFLQRYHKDGDEFLNHIT
jgi:hypothetical protein